ncbi:alpha/beta hydrolase [Sphingobium fuliginis]|jgi:pimeloyl-ACP methyl ester carboxylesterase|uniref:Alpha/beta hydrolase n=1 Tax=Sphingobium fuliginis (strain ATCC 27551) TaxID=336203 RepID=A0A292ZGQ8_SPHSA|nr:alpha/beta hydrolase [Sphingobium fuliginis]QOT70435.1 alpha/beta hydrolase [Sphingobium fuliginis]GAY22106.1 beta-ketoadipate enol-lactone hydrolase [Sphingobium fuliginis]
MKKFNLTINGVSLACIEAGEGPLVLLMHGTFAGKQLMMPQLLHLSRHFRCVAFDWPGHGESGAIAGGWTVEDLVPLLPAMIEALGEDRAFLCGVSQGGAVSMRAALAYPDKVRGLVNMCAGPGGPPPPAAKVVADFAALLADEPDETARRTAVEDFVRRMFHDPQFPTRAPDRFKEEVDLILSHKRGYVKYLPNVPLTYKLLSDEELGAIRCPTLIVWAEFENRPTLGAQLASVIPDSELVIIKNAGHHVNVDQPEATSLALEGFLRKHAKV